jgi:transcriptional regulator with XRE-family HTH domain
MLQSSRYFAVVTIHEIIAKNIRAIRKHRNLTQEALAGKVSFHVNYLARVERCEEKLSLDGLAKIAKALKIKPNLLLLDDVYKLSSEELEKRLGV